MISAPVDAVYWASVFSMHSGAALERLVGMGKGDETDDSRALAQIFFKQWEASRSKLPQTLIDAIMWDNGCGTLLSMADEDTSDELRRGLAATLSSAIVLLWAAFECTASDIIVAMLNAYPLPLSTNLLVESNKKFDLGELAASGFDIKGAVGDFLVRTRRIEFSDLNSLKSVYERSFKGEWDTKIIDLRMMHPVEVLRNLIAHRAGDIDQRFLDTAKNLPDLQGSGAIGEKYVVHGDLVARFVERCTSLITKIVLFCDEWAVRHDASEGST